MKKSLFFIIKLSLIYNLKTMRFFRIFKLTKPKRIVIFMLTTIFALLSIILGSVFYLAPNTILGSEYQTSAQYIINVSDPSSDNAKTLAIKAANDIKWRIDGDSNKGVATQAEVMYQGKDLPDKAVVRVTYPNVLSDSQKKDIENLIISKPNLVFTDYYGNALFDSTGSFNPDLKIGADPGNWIKDPQNINWNVDSKVPIKSEGVTAIYQKKPLLDVTLRDINAQTQWTKATEYASKLPDEKRVIVAWLDLNEFINIAKTKWKSQWEIANHNPYFFAFVGNSPVDANGKPNLLKSSQINAARYLISDNNKPKEQARGDKILLQRPVPTSSSDLNHIVRQINYGTASYELGVKSSLFIPSKFNYGFSLFIISASIIFALLTLFLVWNYGIMGLIGSLSIALFTFLTWTLVTFLGGIFTPIVVGAFIFMIAFFVDKSIVFFEKIKNSLYQGATIQKSLQSARRKTTPIIFDTHNIVIMLAIGLFYFGAVSMWGFSLTLVVGITMSLLILFLFMKMLVIILLNTNIFDNRLHLLGLKPKMYKQEAEVTSTSSINFIKQSRYVWYGGLTIVGIALIVMIIFMSINLSFASGLSLSQTLNGGSIIEIGGPMTQEQANSLIQLLIKNGVNRNDITQFANNNIINSLFVSTNYSLNFAAIKNAINSLGFSSDLSTVLSVNGITLVIGALIGSVLALLFIFIYVLFRFRWTFSIVIFAMVLFDLLIMLSIFIIFRLSFNFESVVALLLLLIYSITNNIYNFTQIKEQITIHSGTLNHKTNVEIANVGVTKNLKRLFYSTLMFIILFAILLIFVNIITFSLAFILMLGVLISAISTIFIGPSLWVKLETYRQKKIEKRFKNKFWDVNKPEEQLFNGINNYNI